ncbi:MAG: histidine kinase [Romboutsia sp.]
MRKKIKLFKNKISNKLIDCIRQTNINKRLIISFLIISIVPIILIFIVVNKTTVNLIKENIKSNDKISSKLITEAIANYTSKFDTITNEIIWNATLLNDIKDYESLSPKEKDTFNYELSKLIRSRTTYISDIADFTIVNEDLDVVYNEGFSYIGYDKKIETILKVDKENKLMKWSAIRSSGGKYIVLTKSIKFGDKVYGHIFLAIKEKVILEMFKDYNMSFNGGALILDENSSLVSTNNTSLFKNENKYNKNIKLVEKIDNFTSIVKIDNKKFILTNRFISYASWNLLGFIPYDYIYLSCINIYKIYTLVSLVMIALSIYIALIINKSITRPINEIVYTMNNVNESNIGKDMLISGNDEISFIMKKYNEMSKRLKQLIETVKLREEEKREVTLRMLQAQINPHFLFNTLGSLRYISIMNNDTSVANGLEALAKLLRSIILNKDDFITINEEIDNVKNYITIQKVRYGDTFDVEYFIDESIKHEKILKFILQPIVENCILHGFEEDNISNHIKLNIYSNEEFINFEIIDNGIGIDEKRLEEGNFNIDKFAGIGVKNIKERLNLYYFDIFTFEITSKYKNGTVTKIMIPKIMGECNENINS